MAPARRTSLGVALRGMAIGRTSLRCRTRMPGRSWTGPLPEMTPEQRRLEGELRGTVRMLAEEIGPRSVYRPDAMARTVAYLTAEARRTGAAVDVSAESIDGVACPNIEATVVGGERADEIIVVGAHYDTVELRGGAGCAGANDNGSGVAATLALLRRWAARGEVPARTVRFVFFANEEPPFFWTERMGSLVYARRCKARGERVVAMLTPETIGCYSDEPGTQLFPPGLARFYPSRGDFIAFVGLSGSCDLVTRCVGTWRERVAFPSEGAAVPSVIPMAGASDHWSFDTCGYPALMVTDTAPFRYRHYHTVHDTPEKLDYSRMARVADGLDVVLRELAGG